MWKLKLSLAATCVLAPTLAFADIAPGMHAGRHAPAMAPLLLLTFAYVLGARYSPRQIGALRAATFASGILILFVTTVSAVAEWSELLFSTHMAQHLMLMLICAPLLVLARTTPVVMRSLSPVLKAAALRRLSQFLRRLLRPVAIWLCFIGLFLLWHLPRLYAAALHSETVHALEHASFLLSAFAFWTVVMAPAGRRAMDHGARALYVVSAALLSGLPGALIALSSRPFYATDPAAAARLGLTPLEDQQLAGLVMWIPGGLAFIVAVLVLLIDWMREADRLALRKQAGRRDVILWTALLSLMLAGCDDVTPRGFGAKAAAVNVPGGDPSKGAADIAAIGCGACHEIPGVNGAIGLVGPPLDHMGRRIYIAGLLRNTPENLQAWLRNPQKVVPGNVMPDMGITEEQSRDIAAYLYTLQ